MMKRSAGATKNTKLIGNRWKGPEFIQREAENAGGRPRIREERQKVPCRLTGEVLHEPEVISDKIIAEGREIGENRSQTDHKLCGSPPAHCSIMIVRD